MIALNRNRQKMFYSVPTGTVSIYERDDDGNIIYIETTEGEQIPMDTGERDVEYGEPIPFSANINGKIKSVIMQAFGADDSANYCLLVCTKNQLPFTIGTIIWRKSVIERKEDGKIDYASADYVVRGILDESLNEDRYLLRRLKVEVGDV